MPAEVIDTLELNIKTKADQAKKKLDSLATSIETFGQNVAKYVNDMKSFGDALEKIANAATELSKVRNLGNLVRSATSANARLAGGRAQITKAAEAARIRKQENAAWKRYDEWNRDYQQSHRLNWKEVKRTSDIYARRNAPPDYTNQEIAAWKAEEDRKMLPYWKNRAEGIVADRTVQPRGWKDVIEEANGIGRDFKSAEESARAIAEELGPVEKRANIIRSYDEYKGKDWRQENAEDTSYFDRELGRIVSEPKAQKNILASIQKMNVGNVVTGNGMSTEIAEAKQEAIGLEETVRQTADDFMENVSQAEILQMKLDVVKQQMEEAVNADKYDESKVAKLADQYDKLSKKIKQVGDAANNSEKESRGLKDVLKAAGSTFGNSGVGKLLGQFGRILKMRFLRDLAKNLFGDINEGISNLYGWSDKIGGHFAGAMDTLASKAMLAKNSIATAFAPAIEALVPLVSTAVGWINNLSNAFAQLVALLTGKNTWTKAVETSEKWGDATKKAGSGAKTAAKKMKDLLADWDELNIIQSKTGGGSGGGSGSEKTPTDYSKMFKEMTAFDEWTRYFEQIKQIVAAIGLGIAGWNLIDIGADFLRNIGVAETTVDNISSKLHRGLSGIVALTVSFSLAQATGKSIARNGLTVTNVLTGLGSLISGALGGYFIASAINPGLGVIGAIGGLTMSLAVGFVSYFDERRTALYETVDEYLEMAVMGKVFTFDVDAVVERVNATVANAEAARRDVRDQLESVLTTVEVLKLGVDEKNTWNELYKKVVGDGENSLIGKIQKELKEDKNVITLYYQTKSREGLEGKANGTTVANGMKTELMANSWLSKEYERLGKKFGDCFVEGEVASIKAGKEKEALAILQSITDAELAAEKARAAAELNIEMKNKLSNLDDDVVMDEMASVFDEYEQKLADARKKIAEEHYITLASTLAELKSLGADDSLIQSVQKLLDEAQKELDDGNWVIKVHAEFFEDEKKMFGEELVKRYGPELAQLVSALSGEYLGDIDFLNEVMNKGGYDSFVQMLMQDFMNELPESAKNWLLENNVNLEDFFTDEQKKKVQEGRNRIEPDVVEEVIETGLDGTAERINAEVDSILDVIRENAEKSGMSVEDYIAGMDASEIWPILESIKEVLDKSNLNSGEQDALDEMGGLTSDLVDGDLDNIYQLLKDRYAEETKTNSWFNPEQGLTVDAATSGMALDSTMENVGNTLQANAATMEGLVTTVATRMLDVIASNDRAANRPINVNISPSTGFGRTMGFSNNMFGRIIG